MINDHEYESKAWVNGKLVEVVATYEVDYPDALIYGVFEKADPENDLTELIHPDEFDRIYSEICAKVVSDMTDAAEMACDMER